MTSNPTSYVRIPEARLKEYVQQENEIITLKQQINSLTVQLQAALAISAQQPTLVEALAPTPALRSPTTESTNRTRGASTPIGPVQSDASLPAPLAEAVSILSPAISDPLTLPKEHVTPSGRSPMDGVRIESARRTAVPYWEIYKGTLDYIKSLPNPSNHAPSFPYLLDERSITVIMNAIEMGMTRNGAAALCGITKNAMERYRANATREIEPYSTFFSLMEMAEARTEADLVAKWQAHTRESWQAAEAFMKRRFAATWGDRSSQTTLTPQELASLSIEELARIAGVSPDDIILDAQLITDGEDDTYGTD